MHGIEATSQQKNNQKVQNDKYSNLNPKPKPASSNKDAVRNPDPQERPGIGPDKPGGDNPSQYPDRHPDEIPNPDPNEIPDQENLHNKV